MAEVAFNEPIDKQCLLRTVSKVNILPRTVSIIPVKAKCKYSNYPAISLIEPVASLVAKNLMGVRCLAPVNHGFTICQIMNPTQSPISVEAGSTIAKYLAWLQQLLSVLLILPARLLLLLIP